MLKRQPSKQQGECYCATSPTAGKRDHHQLDSAEKPLDDKPTSQTWRRDSGVWDSFTSRQSCGQR